MIIEIEKEITMEGTKYWIKEDGLYVDVYKTEEDAISRFNELVKFYSIVVKKEIIKSIEIKNT